tara:strand:+ start:31 stop:279 length:249 start_codon:yes stop_codon:yes gene_type:complete
MKGGALMSGGVKACYLEAVLQYTGRLARSNQLKLAVLRRISAQNVDMNLSREWERVPKKAVTGRDLMTRQRGAQSSVSVDVF